jgi:hypothetical protein
LPAAWKTDGTKSSLCHRNEDRMLDLFCVLIALVFFALCWAFARACDSL